MNTSENNDASLSSSVGVGRTEWEREATARTGAGLVFDPFETFAALRDQGPVHATSISELFGVPDPLAHVFGDRPHFATMDFATTSEVLNDASRFSNSGLKVMSEQSYGSSSFQASDGIEHRRYRRLAQPVFSRQGLGLWSESLASRLDELIDGFVEDGAANLYFAYCAQFPAFVTSKAMGIPEEDFESFGRWAALLQTGAGDPTELVEVSRLVVEYLRDIIAARRRSPGEDLISKLVSGEIVDERGAYRPTDDEVLGLVRNIMPAGVGTTFRTLGILLVALLERPALLARVMADRSLVRAVIEEALRWNPPVIWMMRVAEHDTELAGHFIPKGAIVEGCIGAANHDPARFDNPEVFDPDRPSRTNLSFSVGPHFCVGAQVGRMEIDVSLNKLLDRLPALRADPSQEPARITGLMFRMPTSVPATWN